MVGIVMVIFGMMGQSAPRPAGAPTQGRSVVMARQGMAATSHPLAAEVAIHLLRQGGNAVDAAIGANAVMGLVEPMSCGIGGDLFAIVWDAKSQKIFGLNASGRAPIAANIDLFKKMNLARIPDEGPLSWSVPGCVDGWEMLRSRFGSMSYAQTLAPAIDLAENGFPVVELIGTFWQASESSLQSTPEMAQTFLKDGKSPPIGSLMTNPYLADTYRRIANEGRDALYKGAIAREIVDYSKRVGGLFSIEDFIDHKSEWVEPMSVNYRGVDIWELPPNGQGIAVLQMLKLLEKVDVKGAGPNSTPFIHAFIEAKKLAYEDRARFYADPLFYKDAPVRSLISDDYAKQRWQLFDPTRAQYKVTHGDPKLQAGDTIYLTIVDKDRNVVSLIQSNYYGWGSGMVPGNLGFCLQNRGCLFALDEAHPNRLEPGKRPFHTIIPALATKNGKPWLSFGVMGGDMQPQGHVQVLCNVIDHGMNIQLAGEMPRIRHLGSSEPTGSLSRGSGQVIVERGISPQTVEELKQKGHDVRYANAAEFGGYQAILIDQETGLLHGASEHRKDGAAIGY